jgi:hypothetical protein
MEYIRCRYCDTGWRLEDFKKKAEVHFIYDDFTQWTCPACGRLTESRVFKDTKEDKADNIKE